MHEASKSALASALVETERELQIAEETLELVADRHNQQKVEVDRLQRVRNELKSDLQNG